MALVRAILQIRRVHIAKSGHIKVECPFPTFLSLRGGIMTFQLELNVVDQPFFNDSFPRSGDSPVHRPPVPLVPRALRHVDSAIPLLVPPRRPRLTANKSAYVKSTAHVWRANAGHRGEISPRLIGLTWCGGTLLSSPTTASDAACWVVCVSSFRCLWILFREENAAAQCQQVAALEELGAVVCVRFWCTVYLPRGVKRSRQDAFLPFLPLAQALCYLGHHIVIFLVIVDDLLIHS
ncbi:hypothetical protein HAV15_008607 [Penicillium sp. str. |nr:hypothetical protein HAV15_008607 [Penicillium sp. str. \